MSYLPDCGSARNARSVINDFQPGRENEAERLATLCLGDNIP